ncbi:SET domain-containing protein 3, partial [Spiromyces aspiralis]
STNGFKHIDDIVVESGDVTRLFQSIIHDIRALRPSPDALKPVTHLSNHVTLLSSAVYERPLPVHTEVVPASNPPMRGVFASQPLVQGSYLGEYKGRIDIKSTYSSDPKNFYTLLKTARPFVAFHPHADLCVDARRCGDRLRFMRRSCNPNTFLRSTYIHNSSDPFIRLGVFASKDIQENEEVTVSWSWDANRLPAILSRSEEELEQYLSTPEGRRVSKIWRQVFAGYSCACNRTQECDAGKLLTLFGVSRDPNGNGGVNSPPNASTRNGRESWQTPTNPSSSPSSQQRRVVSPVRSLDSDNDDGTGGGDIEEARLHYLVTNFKEKAPSNPAENFRRNKRKPQSPGISDVTDMSTKRNKLTQSGESNDLPAQLVSTDKSEDSHNDKRSGGSGGDNPSDKVNYANDDAGDGSKYPQKRRHMSSIPVQALKRLWLYQYIITKTKKSDDDGGGNSGGSSSNSNSNSSSIVVKVKEDEPAIYNSPSQTTPPSAAPDEGKEKSRDHSPTPTLATAVAAAAATTTAGVVVSDSHKPTKGNTVGALEAQPPVAAPVSSGPGKTPPEYRSSDSSKDDATIKMYASPSSNASTASGKLKQSPSPFEASASAAKSSISIPYRQSDSQVSATLPATTAAVSSTTQQSRNKDENIPSKGSDKVSDQPRLATPRESMVIGIQAQQQIIPPPKQRLTLLEYAKLRRKSQLSVSQHSDNNNGPKKESPASSTPTTASLRTKSPETSGSTTGAKSLGPSPARPTTPGISTAMQLSTSASDRTEKAPPAAIENSKARYSLSPPPPPPPPPVPSGLGVDSGSQPPRSKPLASDSGNSGESAKPPPPRVKMSLQEYNRRRNISGGWQGKLLSPSVSSGSATVVSGDSTSSKLEKRREGYSDIVKQELAGIVHPQVLENNGSSARPPSAASGGGNGSSGDQ